MSHFIPFISKKMKIPFKPYKAEDADIFTIDAIHQKYWKDFCDVCYPLFEFERIEDGERTYEQKYETFRMCHTMAIDYFKWNEKIVFKVGEQDFKRFKDAYDLFISLSTADKASIPMLLVLFRMQQSIWDRLRKDRLMMEYIYPRECTINYGQYEIDHLEHFPEDENTISDIDDIDKFICNKLAICRDYDEMWARAFEDFENHHSDEYQGEPIEWDNTVGDLVCELADHILHSYNYSLHEFIHKYSEIVTEGKGDVVKAIVYRLFLSYQSSLLEIKKVFEDYPAKMCISKLEQRRHCLIKEFKDTKLGAHWYECILLSDGLEKVGKFLMNHRDVITIDDEAHFFHLLDEICIITDILRGNTKKYWLNVDFIDGTETDKKSTCSIENTILKKNHNGKRIDFQALHKMLGESFVDEIKFGYEWLAPWRMLYDLSLLEDTTLTAFAEQMNKWYPDAKKSCSADSMGDYFNPYLGSTAFVLWDENEFKKRKTSKQSINGYRLLYNDCEAIKEALKSFFKQ